MAAFPVERARGNSLNKGGDARMPLHRTIGISLALMVISAGANAQTATKSTAQDPVHAAKPEEAHSRAARARARQAVLRRVQARRGAVRHVAPSNWRVVSANATASERYVGAAAPGAHGDVGMAAWYDLQGRRTASGERFDDAALSAAHRTLPLHSYARVTDLDNGRSVVVEINDRGPWTRGLMIDLSEAAAERLHMIGAGVAHVAVEPLGDQPPAAPQLAMTSGAAPAAKPQLVAYHPDPPPVVAAKSGADPQPRQEAWLRLMIDLSQAAAARLHMIGAALAVKPQPAAYHPDPSPAAAAKSSADPQPQQEAWLRQNLIGSQ
jgi:rare lipoprotein A